MRVANQKKCQTLSETTNVPESRQAPFGLLLLTYRELQMKIAVLTTGDEIMQGVITDQNNSWISEKCHALGHVIVWHAACADDHDAIEAMLKEAADRADCVIVTGGLGPTADDMTIEAACKAFGKKLVFSESVFKEIENFFTKLHIPMSPSNKKQAYFPEGAIALPNKIGTAPGIHVHYKKIDFFFLPGVPLEMKHIFDVSVLPWLASKTEMKIVQRTLRCFGLPEADIDHQLQEVDLEETRLSYRYIFPETLLKIVARGRDEKKLHDKVNRVAENIRKKLGNIIYGEEAAPLSAVVLALLQNAHATLSIAESCTGGWIANMLTNIPGASTVFQGGVIAYSDQIKMNLLGVKAETLQAYGAVSAEVASEMAKGIQQKLGTTFGLGTTGIAGPTGGTKEKPVGMCYIALASPSGVEVQSLSYGRDRLEFK